MTDVLDDPVGESLRGHHTHLARHEGRALAYQPDVATFVAVPATPTTQDWSDLATLLGPGGFADLFSSPVAPPDEWAQVFTMPGVQMIGPPAPDQLGHDPEIVELGPADVTEMDELAAATRPGPFWPRTYEMGTYLGIRREGRLVAMAGERLHPPGWTEISAVCTAPVARGQGMASQLVRSLISRADARDEQSFLHVAADNAAAIGLYERLGFQVSRTVTFHGSRIPD